MLGTLPRLISSGAHPPDDVSDRLADPAHIDTDLAQGRGGTTQDIT
jgi:hypothetical protein